MQLTEQATLELVTVQTTTETTPVKTEPMATTIKQEPTDWSKAFNTSILSTVLDSKSLDGEIEVLLDTPEYQAILLAAQSLSAKLHITPEVATERLIQTFRGIDSCWEKILLKKGAQSLLGL